MIESIAKFAESYKGVSTEDLLILISEAEDRCEYTPNASERELWKQRLSKMKEELYHRQQLSEEIEL